MPTDLYLHGFASSPRSTKAQYLRDRFAEQGRDLQILDLNRGGFQQLTLSRQLAQARAALPEAGAAIALGSSFGGLTVAWLAEQCPQLERIVCLAPAFNFAPQWRSRLGEAQWQQWQTTGTLSVYHYGDQRQRPLDYGFATDLAQYRDAALQRSVPTLILHGRDDDVVPIQAARDYQRDRPWVELVELESDHTLGNVLPQLWTAIAEFCHLSAPTG